MSESYVRSWAAFAVSDLGCILWFTTFVGNWLCFVATSSRRIDATNSVCLSSPACLLGSKASAAKDVLTRPRDRSCRAARSSHMLRLGLGLSLRLMWRSTSRLKVVPSLHRLAQISIWNYGIACVGLITRGSIGYLQAMRRVNRTTSVLVRFHERDETRDSL